MKLEQEQMTHTDELLGTREVAELLGVDVSTVYAARHHGRGPVSYRRGKRLVFRRTDVDAFLARERDATLRGAGV
jgi:excisionase family DNA binding protein